MFDIDIIETPSLGDRSYLFSDGAVAAVVDPQRDIDRILDLAASRNVRITHVLETHLHNDYVSGGVELAAATGAAYLLSADDDVSFDRDPIRDGDVVTVGRMRLRAIHTPGHTHHHLSYALQTPGGDTEAVFTGGSLLYASTGRTDLLGAEHTDALTHAQYRSVQRLARELPDATRVMPTHGFGSFCSATPTSGAESTIAEQRQVNPGLTQDEQAFVDELIAGLDAYPAYYAHMGPLNSAPPAPVDLSMPVLVDPAELRARIEAGQWVVDLRSRTAFAAGHLAGTLSFELSDKFLAYLGWLHPWGDALTLIGDTPDQILDARRELVRIGIDRLDGAAVGDPTLNAPPAQVRSYPVTDFAGLATALSDHQVHVLDTRRDDERAKSAVPGSQHIPLHELSARLDEVAEQEVWVHCGSGYRAAIAASLCSTTAPAASSTSTTSTSTPNNSASLRLATAARRPADMLAALGFGLLIGALLGLLGGGGSVLAVPALIYGVGQPLHQAIPTSLLVVGVSSLAGALRRIRARQIRWRMAVIFGVTGSIAAFAGTAVNSQLPARTVLIGFAAIMVVAGIAMLRDHGTAGTACALPGATINWRRCLPRSLGAGLTVGFLTGLFGVGGGFLIIPALVLLLGLDMALAVGTSLVIIVLNSTSGLLAHLGHTHLAIGVSIAFTATAVLGALAAARLAIRLPTDRLQRWFAYLVFAIAAFVVAQTIINPGAT